MSLIPKHFHFVFGLKPQEEEFHILYYLTLRSCIEVNQPERIRFHYHYEPHGQWWERIKPELELVHVDLEEFIIENELYSKHQEGRFIQWKELNYAHQADFIRLRILKECGGVYADMDTLFVNRLPPELFEQDFVIGTEGELKQENAEAIPSLCNALMMSKPKAQFVSTWLDRMYQVFDGTWSRHSCQEASIIGQEMPGELMVVPQHFFYKYDYTPEGIARIFTQLDLDIEDIYSIHLWNHLWWEETRTDFSNFHAGLLTEDFIRNTDTTYNELARQFLPAD